MESSKNTENASEFVVLIISIDPERKETLGYDRRDGEIKKNSVLKYFDIMDCKQGILND